MGGGRTAALRLIFFHSIILWSILDLSVFAFTITLPSLNTEVGRPTPFTWSKSSREARRDPFTIQVWRVGAKSPFEILGQDFGAGEDAGTGTVVFTATGYAPANLYENSS